MGLLPVVAEGANQFTNILNKAQDFGVGVDTLATSTVPGAVAAYKFLTWGGQDLTEATEATTVALVEEKEAIEEVTEAAVEGINAQLLSVQNKRDAVKAYQEWYRTYVDAQLAEFDREEEAFTFQIGNLEGLRDAAILAAKRRNDELVADDLETLKEKAELAADEKEIDRLALIAEIKASVRREKLLHKFKFLSADVQDEIREDAYQHGRILTDVIEDYLENVLNVHVTTNNKLVEDNDDTIDEMQEGWDGYIASQDATMLAIKASGISFTDIVNQMAADSGMTAVEMAAHLMEMGVAFGDVMGLIDATGTATIDKLIANFKGAQRATTVGGGGGRGGGGRNASGGSLPGMTARAGSLVGLIRQLRVRIRNAGGRNADTVDDTRRLEEALAQFNALPNEGRIPSLANGPSSDAVANSAIAATGNFNTDGGGDTVQIIGDSYGMDDLADKIGEGLILIGRRGG